MSDLLEHDLRGALAERAARITPGAGARLRAVDYHPRSRRRPSSRILGAVGLSGIAAAAGTIILLGSSAAPAFAGWTANPTAPQPGQLTAAERDCGAAAGTPVLTDTRGPYTAAVYANGSTCLQGNGIEIRSANEGGQAPSAPAGKIELNGVGESDSNGHAVTMVYGAVGTGVAGVTISRSDGSSVQATVANGWYLAWWPGYEHALTASVRTASATSTQSFPSQPDRATPACPPGAQCSSGYGFESGSAHGAGSMTVGTTNAKSGGQ